MTLLISSCLESRRSQPNPCHVAHYSRRRRFPLGFWFDGIEHRLQQFVNFLLHLMELLKFRLADANFHVQADVMLSGDGHASLRHQHLSQLLRSADIFHKLTAHFSNARERIMRKPFGQRTQQTIPTVDELMSAKRLVIWGQYRQPLLIGRSFTSYVVEQRRQFSAAPPGATSCASGGFVLCFRTERRPTGCAVRPESDPTQTWLSAIGNPVQYNLRALDAALCRAGAENGRGVSGGAIYREQRRSGTTPDCFLSGRHP